MATYATPDDVRRRWLSSTPLPADETIQSWLDDAEVLIFAEFPKLADSLTTDPDGTLRTRVIYVEVQLVSTALKNPEAVRQNSRTAGVFTESTTYGTETLSQAMELTPAHRAMLSGGAKKHTGFDMTAKPSALINPLAHAWVNGPDESAPGQGY
ncbi:hypothetical protein [Corynebacterium flavescens]|uniref:hypothetical protein n=1 Tax=Corynebacterium flavescens TaxID=28028 RepID=UPI00289F821A|nr:hypothetical protein [Corynebacterium flavescens]